MVTGWYGQSLVFPLAAMPGYGDDYEVQAARREAMAAAHPEIDWLGRIGDAHSAYVHLPRGGYQAGDLMLAGLLDKLDEFFEATGSDEPDTG